jgi:hypothetical protein
MKFAGEVSLRGVDVRPGPCGTICLQKSRSEPLGVSVGTARGERRNRSAEREEESLKVARDRIELSTSRFSVARSYQLSYLALVQTQSIREPAIRGKSRG